MRSYHHRSSRFHIVPKVTDQCNSQLNELTTKYYRLLKWDDKGNLPTNKRREAEYRGKHSLSPGLVGGNRGKRRGMERREAVTPEIVRGNRLVCGNVEGVGVRNSPLLVKEKTTSTNDLPLFTPSPRPKLLRPQNSVLTGHLPLTPSKHSERTLPPLRLKKRIDIDMRGLHSRRRWNRQLDEMSVSSDSNCEVLTPLL